MAKNKQHEDEFRQNDVEPKTTSASEPHRDTTPGESPQAPAVRGPAEAQAEQDGTEDVTSQEDAPDVTEDEHQRNLAERDERLSAAPSVSVGDAVLYKATTGRDLPAVISKVHEDAPGVVDVVTFDRAAEEYFGVEHGDAERQWRGR